MGGEGCHVMKLATAEVKLIGICKTTSHESATISLCCIFLPCKLNDIYLGCKGSSRVPSRDESA